MNRPKTLARYTIGGGGLFTAAVVASSPQTVLVGGIPTMYRTTGVASVPLSFLIVMVVIGLLAVGYVRVGRRVKHGAPFYAQLVHGASPWAGLVAAGVAFVGYNALQISLYPLLGTTLAGLFGGIWWWWAAGAWLVVFWLGRHPGAVNAKLLGVLLALELAVIVLFIAAGFSRPASGSISMQVFAPGGLLAAGSVASVVVFAVAAFAGLETVLAYAEEAKTSRALEWAAGTSIAVCGILYCLASWAYGGWVGLDQLADATADDNRQPLALLDAVFGPGILELATLLLVTSVLAAMGALSAAVARYVFALSREGVLPASWGTVSRGAAGGAPLGGSTVQAVTAALVLGVFLAVGADPLGVVFPWLSTIGAFCVLLLLTASSWSALNFFDRGRGGADSVLVRRVFPFAGGIAGVLAVVFMASSLGALLGTPPGSPLPWLIAVPIGAAALAGLAAGSWLRAYRPEIYDGLGLGVPAPERVLDDDLAEIEI
ncbi:APC family permease [Paractinoplanes rishiriensis]|uniref:Amino acid permease n=1 Tax=Paractinoplanes rishiriensis TaxID=1050105 RepID=A0A919K948_9ACTN|nr:amino acid permease [Actinoplanes rishiriensis]GIF01111.1 amino acid permease [Actinoplanes rishiriensis]